MHLLNIYKNVICKWFSFVKKNPYYITKKKFNFKNLYSNKEKKNFLNCLWNTMIKLLKILSFKKAKHYFTIYIFRHNSLLC